jgi:hypothetical protein
MTTTSYMASFLILAGCSNKDPAPAPAIACNLNGLTDAERLESRQLREKLERAIVSVDERPAGYALQLEEARLPLPALSRWIELERRCCPFFHFDVEVKPSGAGTWLHLSGADGVKEFIASTLPTGGAR